MMKVSWLKIESLILVVIGLIVCIFTLYMWNLRINDAINHPIYNWGDIPLAGIPFFAIIIILVLLLMINLIEIKQTLE